MRRFFAFCTVLMLCAGLLVLPVSAYDMGKVGEPQVISANGDTSFAIDENGGLWAWGSNFYGQLGNGKTDTSETSQPAPVKIMDDVAAVSAGGNHVMAIKTNGALWAWGYSFLGNGEFDGSTVPVKVMDNVAAVSAGTKHTMVIKTDGTLWAWGENNDGQLGDGTRERTPDPVKIMDDVVAVSAGADHTMAIKTDGTLWAWGDSGCGKLGCDSSSNPLRGGSIPKKVMDDVVAVVAGNEHTVALKTDGHLWGWGDSAYIGKHPYFRYTPVELMDNVEKISAGYQTVMAIKTDGSLWAWGHNEYGQLGDADLKTKDGIIGQSAASYTPVKVLDHVAAVSASSGAHTMAVKTDGTLWAWGRNGRGQLGYEGGNAQDYNAAFFGRDSRFASICQTVPKQALEGITWATSGFAIVPGKHIAEPALPKETGMAYPSTQLVDVDGREVELQCYALKDEQGNYTNYIKIRDLANVLNGSAAQFQVDWSPADRHGYLDINTQTPYTPNGTEGTTPFDGEREYRRAEGFYIRLNGRFLDLSGFVLHDDNGGGYTYYQLRDLGKALGFNVGWDAGRGVFLETGKAYDYSN